MKKVVVTGANGQLAKCLKALVEVEKPNGFQFVFLDRTQLDISNPTLVETFFFSNPVDYVVNCAAYTAVDQAETDIENAFKINADGAGFLAEACQEHQATLIQVSTDYVFDGKNEKPYLPTDIPHPINVYGKSKLAGEQLALAHNAKTFVIRTSWLYAKFGKNFYTTMLRLMQERDSISVVADQIGKPTYAPDLAQYIYELILEENTDYGIHHFAGNEVMSWFEFAQKIALENGFTTEIVPIPSTEYPTPAKRPKFSILG